MSIIIPTACLVLMYRKIEVIVIYIVGQIANVKITFKNQSKKFTVRHLTNNMTDASDPIRSQETALKNEINQGIMFDYVPLYRSTASSVKAEDMCGDRNASCKSSLTLLSVLDDKNRAIAELQQQLDNQKLQLGYYIRKALSSSKLFRLAKTVSSSSSVHIWYYVRQWRGKYRRNWRLL